MIWEIIESYAAAARRMMKASLDGVEIVASHGYLISQFLNPGTTCETTSSVATSSGGCVLPSRHRV